MSKYNLTKGGDIWNNVWGWTNVEHIDSMDPDPHWGRNMNLDKIGNNGQDSASWNWPQNILTFQGSEPCIQQAIFKGTSFVNPPQHTYTTWYQVHTKLSYDLKILLASQKLDENFKFHTELKYEELKQILLSFVAVAGTSRLWRFLDSIIRWIPPCFKTSKHCCCSAHCRDKGVRAWALAKHTLAAAAALASVWCYCYCWVRTSPAAASTHTELVTKPPRRQQLPPKKPWRKSVARASVDVNVERSLSVPKCRTVTERAKM
jgi:hypothetical protein